MQKLLYQAQIEGFYEMFMLDLATGLRRGEIVGLQWKDINLENGTLSGHKAGTIREGRIKDRATHDYGFGTKHHPLSACIRNAHGV